MMILSAILTCTLACIACLHLMWAIGFWIPIKDEEQLAKAVVGSRGITRMPGAVACAVVTLALAFATVLPHLANYPGRSVLMLGISVVFLARGVATYTPQWRRRVPEEPFASLDRSLYGPLCVAIGIGYLTLTLGDM